MKYICGLVLCFIASTAVAQNICAPRADVVKRLWDRWQEVQISLAMVADGRLLEIFVSENGSWTAVISDPGGRSCVASAGKDWTVVEPVIPKEKAL